MIPSPRRVRALARLALGVVMLVLVAAPLVLGREDDVSNPDVAFEATQESTTAAATARVRDHPADDDFEWPVYGFTKQRTHNLPLKVTPRPPYREAWANRDDVLLEFTPVLCGRRVYLLKNNAALYAISRRTGRTSWKRKLGELAAASPACSHGVIYAVMLKRTGKSENGSVVAVDAKDGRTLWSRNLPSRAESSPLLHRGKLYFGSEDGTVYALRARDGKIVWRYRAAGAVKGALALDSGKLYFGDYAGKVQAIRLANGRKVWEVGTSGGRLGLGANNFYSTAAVSYGRVYIGGTNGSIYSFSTADGKLAWRKSTGDFVYASPAVGDAPGNRPTVYVGSYTGRFHALDARSGKTRWVRSLGNKISGAATIVGDLVFVADLGKRTTWALDAADGKTTWKTRRGGFNPVMSDGRRIYLAGLTSLFALDPASRPFDTREARPAPPRDGAAKARARATRSAKRAAARQRRAEVARAERRARVARARARADRRAEVRRARAERRARVRRAQAQRRARIREAREERRARARMRRQRKLRNAPHGHRHSRTGEAPPRCHPHRHVYKVRGKRIVLKHDHCHTHLPRRRQR